MIHLLEVAETENVVGGGGLLELVEVGLNFGAVVRLVLKGHDGDDAVAYQEHVSDRAKLRLEGGRAVLESPEFRRDDVRVEIADETR